VVFIKNQKKQVGVIKVILVVIGIIVVVQVIALILLYLSVGNYKKFWNQKANESGEITYVALGDSAAQGIGATSPMKGYVGLIAKRIEAKTGKQVKVINVSVTGATIRDVIDYQIPQIASIDADIITIEAGANDIKNFNKETFRLDFTRLLELLPKRTYVSNMPLFNSRPGSTQPAKDASVIVKELVAKDSDKKFVELQKQTEENQSIFGFAPDLFHPNNLSYKNWADAFWKEIEPNLKD
jgi:acyl-CoA thioesterase I